MEPPEKEKPSSSPRTETMLARQLFVPGSSPEQYTEVALQVVAEQLGKVEKIILVGVKRDDLTGATTGTIFVKGQFSGEIAEKGVDKWTPTTPEAVAKMINAGYGFSEINPETKQVVRTSSVNANIESDSEVFALLKKELGNTVATQVVTSGAWVKVKRLLGGDESVGQRDHLIDPGEVMVIRKLVAQLSQPGMKSGTGWDQAVQALGNILERDGWGIDG